MIPPRLPAHSRLVAAHHNRMHGLNKTTKMGTFVIGDKDVPELK
jgi:hypothetical protein